MDAKIELSFGEMVILRSALRAHYRESVRVKESQYWLEQIKKLYAKIDEEMHAKFDSHFAPLE